MGLVNSHSSDVVYDVYFWKLHENTFPKHFRKVWKWKRNLQFSNKLGKIEVICSETFKIRPAFCFGKVIRFLWGRRSHQFASTPDGDAWAWFREKCLEWVQIPSWGNSGNCFLLTMFSVFSINHLSARGPCNLCTKVFLCVWKKRYQGSGETN